MSSVMNLLYSKEDSDTRMRLWD